MIGYLILAVLVAFIAVVAIRTIRFRPKPQPEVTKEEIAFDRDATVEDFMDMLKVFESDTLNEFQYYQEDNGEWGLRLL